MIRRALLLALLPATLAAQEAPSLFFSADEMARVEDLRRRAAAPPPKAPEPEPEPEVAGALPPPDIHVGAVIYFAPDRWAVWLNGQRRTTSLAEPDLRIAAVGPDRVELLWTGDPKAGPLRIRLRSHQTFLGATGEIVDGALR